MFTEILRIKPVIDTASATRMEVGLGQRFRRISANFKRGIGLAVKGSIVGLSLTLLTRFLNPLEKIEEKIRKLLDEAKGQGDLADELGTTPGKLRAVQNVAGSLGVTPDTLKDLLSKYAKAIEKAKDEIQNPSGEISDSTRALKNFANDKDVLESFFQFIQSLKGVSAVPRQAIEKAVFDETLKGQGKRLIDANYTHALLSPPATSAQLNSAYSNLQAREQQDRTATINRETLDLIRTSRNVTPGVIGAIQAKAQRDLDKESLDFKNFQNLKKAQETVDTIAIGVEAMQQAVLQLVTLLTTLVQYISGIKASRIIRGINSLGGDK